MMIIKIIFVIVTWLPAFLIPCPTIIDGWTFQFKPDVDTVIQGKFLNSQFPAFFFYFQMLDLKLNDKIAQKFCRDKPCYISKIVQTKSCHATCQNNT